MIDQHVHTTISHDGKSSIKEYLDIMKDNDEVTFTEHYDIYEKVESNLKTIEIEEYYNDYIENTKNTSRKTNFGIEIGLRPECKNTIINMVKNNNFDFIIGSSHITNSKDMSMDPTFFEGKTRNEAYNGYLNEVLENIEIFHDYFDVYGHLDYVVRYPKNPKTKEEEKLLINHGINISEYQNRYLDYHEFEKKIDEILALLIKYNKGIEINTSGIRYGLNMPHPNIDILRAYKNLGGNIITIGSDAHNTNDLMSDFNIAIDILKEVGFDSISSYHQRKRSIIKLEELK